MRCEKCSVDHDGSYASGRFCSSKCAKSFSTTKNRKDINEKVKKKLKGLLLGNRDASTRYILTREDQKRGGELKAKKPKTN